MAVAGMNTAPVIDDDVGTKLSDDANHVFQDLAVPDFFGFFGSFREAEIASASEIKFHAIATCGGK
jgi:hypothetical protein